MTGILNRLLIGFLYLISYLPLGVLYLISNLFYYLVYYGIGYRKKIVSTNLKNSFPNKSDEELKKIMKQHYRYFCDVFFETLKLSTASEAFLQKRITFNNPEYINKIMKEGRSVCLFSAHNYNWEIFMMYDKKVEGHGVTIYHKLSNKYFDNFYLKMRTRFGIEVHTMENSYRVMARYASNKAPHTIGIIADQSPSKSINTEWVKFLSQDTKVFAGPEKIARRYNYVSAYTKVSRPKRGYYNVDFVEIARESKQTNDLDIIKSYYSLLEKDICEKPQYYLWTHRLWKKKKPADAVVK